MAHIPIDHAHVSTFNLYSELYYTAEQIHFSN